MSRHVPLYKSALKLVQSLVLEQKLRDLLQKYNIYELIKSMKQFVDTYIRKIKLDEEEEGLTSLVPVLDRTYELVCAHIKPSCETVSGN